MEHFRIGLVAVDPLLERGLVVESQGEAGGVVGARTFERTAGLDLQGVVSAVAVGIYPLAERVARIGWFDLLRPVTTVGEDAAKVLGTADQHIGGVRRDNEFQRPKCNHNERHSAWVAPYGVIKEISLPAVGLVRKALLQNFLILGG